MSHVKPQKQIRDPSLGFSLIEMMVALSILAFVSMAFSSSLFQATTAIKNAEIKSEAQIAAQQTLDVMRLTDPSTMPATVTSDPTTYVVVGNTTYAVTVSYCAKTTYCPPTSSNDTRHVSVNVRYANQVVYQVETVFTKLWG